MRFFGRKAEITISTVVYLVLALLVLLAITYVFWKIVIDTKSTLEDCPGECMAVCGGDRPSTYRNICYKDGESVPNTRCCVNPRDLVPTDPVPAPGPDDLDRPSIEVRLGLLDEPIRHGSIQVLDVGRSYTFWIWGFGTNMFDCAVMILDDTNNALDASHPLAKSVSRQACVDNSKPRNMFERDNKIEIVLEPTEDIVYENYRMQIQLFDVDGIQNQSAIINLRVSQPTTPGDPSIIEPDSCIYDSCEDITSEFHCVNPGSSQVGCPDLRCHWNLPDGPCVTRSSSENQQASGDTGSSATSCTINYRSVSSLSHNSPAALTVVEQEVNGVYYLTATDVSADMQLAVNKAQDTLRTCYINHYQDDPEMKKFVTRRVYDSFSRLIDDQNGGYIATVHAEIQ